MTLLPRVLTDAEGADVHPGDTVVVQHQRGYVTGVYLGVRNERGYPALVRVGQMTVTVFRNVDWVRVSVEQKRGDGQ